MLDLAAPEVPAARAQLERLCAGRRVLEGARFEVHTDGRATYQLQAGRHELARVLQAVGLAAAVSVGSSLGLNWMVHRALLAGFSVGVAAVALGVARDRARLHFEARRLLRSLPGLLRRGQ